MPKYVIVETSYEYNDEHYEQGSGYNIKSKLYSEEQLIEANAEIQRLNEESTKDEWFRDCDDEPITPYKLIKIEE